MNLNRIKKTKYYRSQVIILKIFMMEMLFIEIFFDKKYYVANQRL